MIFYSKTSFALKTLIAFIRILTSILIFENWRLREEIDDSKEIKPLLTKTVNMRENNE